MHRVILGEGKLDMTVRRSSRGRHMHRWRGYPLIPLMPAIRQRLSPQSAWRESDGSMMYVWAVALLIPRDNPLPAIDSLKLC